MELLELEPPESINNYDSTVIIYIKWAIQNISN